MKLNVGCGKVILKDHINLDIYPGDGVDVIHDLNTFPYPFNNDTFNEILANNIMEHLDNPLKFCEELCRITKPNGKLKIITPHFSSGVSSWSDLTHKRTFTSYSFDNYYTEEELDKDKDTFEIYSKMKVKCVSHISFGKFYRKIRIEYLANLNKKVYENYLSGIFPARYIAFNLEVIKYPEGSQNTKKKKGGKNNEKDN